MKWIRVQHRPWLVYAAWSLIALAVMTSNMKGGTVANQIESMVMELMTPVYSSVNWSMNKILSYWDSYISLIDTRVENENLRRELQNNRERIVSLQEKANSVERLEALIQQSSPIAQSILRTRVVRRSNSMLNATMLINSGADDGLVEGHGIATIDGAVGQVVRVGPRIAKVITLHHPDSGIGALLEQSRVQGVVSGTGKGTCIMRFVSRFDTVVLGETVVTSGLDNAFPKGVPIGRVIAIRRDPGEIFQTIEIIPVADLNTIEEIMVYMMSQYPDPAEIEGFEDLL